jgi:aspartate/methionine/tyrosine aminotransferase
MMPAEPKLNPLTLLAARRRALNLPVYDLTVSNPDVAGFAWSRDILAAALGGPGCERHQPDPFGNIEARAAIAEYYAQHGAVVSPKHICLSASTSEAYTWWLRLLCESGDNVLAPEPAYPLISILAEISRVKVIPYRCEFKNGLWSVDPASLKPDAKTRAILAISPANPTGHTLSAVDLKALRDAQQKAAPACALIVDEVFLDYPSAAFAAQPSVLALKNQDPLIILSGLSKVALAPQLKIGWSVLAGSSEWLESILPKLEHHADAFLSVNAPAQVSLPFLLREAPVRRAAVRGRLDANESTLRAALVRLVGCELLPRQAGWSVVVRLPAGVDELNFALQALEEGACVHPGHYYDFASGNSVVLSLLTDPKDFGAGLDALIRALPRC